MIQEQERMRIAINRNGRTPYRHELKTLKTTQKKKKNQKKKKKKKNKTKKKKKKKKKPTE